jgi:ubiquinone/menaquinone biosynthesis C-methylase UbiE
MDEYRASTYGDRIADIYDERYAEVFGGDLAATVAFLKEIAGDGAALELGIGTGRIAIPLDEAGVRVQGIDASEAMVGRLHAKRGGSPIDVTMGDFRDFTIDERFGLVYVVFNTFFGLLTQDDQVSCFRSVARHLTDEGVFAMEAFVPDVTRFERGQRVSATRVELDEVEIEVSQHDALAQRTHSHHLIVREDGVRLYPVRIRYAYPSELDLMARLAGMRLRERWADWDRSPLTATSQKHISVWELDRAGT